MVKSLTNESVMDIFGLLAVMAKVSNEGSLKMNKILSFVVDRVLNEWKSTAKTIFEHIDNAPEGFAEFESKIQELKAKHAADKDFDVDSEANKLKEEYKDVLSEVETIEAENDEFLKLEIDMEVPQIKFEYLPEKMSPREFNIIRPFVKETDDEIMEILDR